MHRLRALLLALILTALLSVSLPAAPARALLLQETLASGETLHKSLRSLQDNHGYSWQLIAFKAEFEPRACLRLVGFPTVAAIDHGAPLIVQAGVALTTVPDETPTFGSPVPPTTVAQYPLAAILAKQSVPAAMALSIPNLGEGDSSSDLHIPKSVAAEWWAILDHEATAYQ